MDEDDEILEVVICRQHWERVAKNNPCDRCPSRADNVDRVLERARAHTQQFKARMVTTNEEHSDLLAQTLNALTTLDSGMKSLRGSVMNVYLIISSIMIMALMSGLLWWEKIDVKIFTAFSAACMFPWYGTGIENMLRAFRGIRDGENHRLGMLIGIALCLLTLLYLT